MYCLCVNVYCHLVITKFQLINISYHKLATCVSWAALNGTKDGQHRQVSLYRNTNNNTEIRKLKISDVIKG
jgi:hypothetical protein